MQKLYYIILYYFTQNMFGLSLVIIYNAYIHRLTEWGNIYIYILFVIFKNYNNNIILNKQMK